MRRFGLIVFVLSVLFALAGLRQEAAEPVAGVEAEGAGSGIAGADIEAKQPANQTDQQPAPVQTAAPAAPGPTVATAADITASIAEARQTRPEAAVPPLAGEPASGSEEADEIDPAIASLSGRELVRTTQAELKRLGCYKAKVDGKWGRKSRNAVESFAERAGDDWAEEPEPELVAALKGFPDGFCRAECTERSADGKCVVASLAAIEPLAKTTELATPVEDDNSYLPPWMRGAEASAAEEPVELAPEPQAAPAPAAAAPKRRVERRRAAPRPRTAERHEPRRSRNRNRTPPGWPGTAR
jgi:peptidoglycan hydrolase-like protein with peptidoglycan-binding domain